MNEEEYIALVESPGEGEGTDQTLNYYKNSHPLQGCHPQYHREKIPLSRLQIWISGQNTYSLTIKV